MKFPPALLWLDNHTKSSRDPFFRTNTFPLMADFNSTTVWSFLDWCMAAQFGLNSLELKFANWMRSLLTIKDALPTLDFGMVQKWQMMIFGYIMNCLLFVWYGQGTASPIYSILRNMARPSTANFFCLGLIWAKVGLQKSWKTWLGCMSLSLCHFHLKRNTLIGKHYGLIWQHAPDGNQWSSEPVASMSCRRGLHEMLPTITVWSRMSYSNLEGTSGLMTTWLKPQTSENTDAENVIKLFEQHKL